MPRKKFSAPPRQEPSDPSALSEEAKAFTKGAEEPAKTTDGPPWEGLDPYAKPTKSVSLRLNPYELERLREAAKRDRRSIQKFIKHALDQGVAAVLD